MRDNGEPQTVAGARHTKRNGLYQPRCCAHSRVFMSMFHVSYWLMHVHVSCAHSIPMSLPLLFQLVSSGLSADSKGGNNTYVYWGDAPNTYVGSDGKPKLNTATRTQLSATIVTLAITLLSLINWH